MELKVAARRFVDDLGRPRQFHYYLTVDQEESSRFCCENYGVLIREDTGAQTAVHAITTSSTRIDELMTLLVDHLVGPAGLEDVLADWL